MTDINSIKSRLGAVNPTVMARLPTAVQKLLGTDMPSLLFTNELQRIHIAELRFELKHIKENQNDHSIRK